MPPAARRKLGSDSPDYGDLAQHKYRKVGKQTGILNGPCVQLDIPEVSGRGQSAESEASRTHIP